MPEKTLTVHGTIDIEAPEDASPRLLEEIAKPDITEGRFRVEDITGINHHATVCFDRYTPDRFIDLVRETLNSSDFMDAQREGDTVVIHGFEANID